MDLIGLFIVSLIFFALFGPKPKIENARRANLGDFQVPRANEGDPVPIIYGTVKLKSPNTIYYGNLRAQPITKKVKTGLFSKKKQTVGYRYHLDMNLSLCHGPDVQISKIWAGKNIAWSGPAMGTGNIYVNQPELFGGDERRGGWQGNIAFYNGAYNQVRDPWLASRVDPAMPAYVGMSHLVLKDFYVGTTENVEMLYAELSRFPAFLAGTPAKIGAHDCNPIQILYDVMTQRWGRLGISPSLIDNASFIAAGNTLVAEGHGMSIKMESNMTGKDFMEEVLRQIDGVTYQDPATGKVKIKLLRKDYSIPSLPVLDESNINELVDFAKTTWSATYNQARVNFINRDNNYADGVAVAQDFANINYQGKVRNQDFTMSGCYNGTLANKLAAKELQAMSVPLIQVTLRVNREAYDLRPADAFVFNWNMTESFSINQLVMRVTEVDLGTLRDGQVTVTAIQDIFSTTTAVFAPPEDTIWTPPSTAAMPVTVRKLFEPPYFFTRELAEDGNPPDGLGAVYVMAQRPNTLSMGYTPQYSDNAWLDTFEGDLAVYNGSGVLTANYPASAGAPNRYDTTGFTLSSVNGQENLIQGTIAGVRDGSALMMIGDEIIGYVGYIANMDGTFTFPRVYRGLFDTVPEDHTAGARAFILSEGDGLLPALFENTKTVRARLLDQTPASVLLPADAPVDNITISGRSDRPAPAAYLTLNGSRTPPAVAAATSVAAAWRPRDRKAANVRIYDDPADVAEAGTDYRVRWRIGAGAWTTDYVSIASHNIDVTGLLGTLEVEVYSRRDGLLSLVGDSLTIELT